MQIGYGKQRTKLEWSKRSHSRCEYLMLKVYEWLLGSLACCSLILCCPGPWDKKFSSVVLFSHMMPSVPLAEHEIANAVKKLTTHMYSLKLKISTAEKFHFKIIGLRCWLVECSYYTVNSGGLLC